MSAKDRRRSTLVQPRLQWKMIGACGLMIVGALVVNAIGLTLLLRGLAAELPTDGMLLLERLPGRLAGMLLVTTLLVGPLVLALGLRYSHRIAGPLFRIERALRNALTEGEYEDLRLRRGDELQELAGVAAGLLRRLEALEKQAGPRDVVRGRRGPEQESRVDANQRAA